jgi:hypothetical protein
MCADRNVIALDVRLVWRGMPISYPVGAYEMSDLTCPYCQHDQEVCYDDGFGMDENSRHEMQCEKCEKYFVFDTCFLVSHTAYSAPCLNGSPHRLELSKTIPREFAKMRCKDCNYEREPTAGEK